MGRGDVDLERLDGTTRVDESTHGMGSSRTLTVGLPWVAIGLGKRLSCSGGQGFFVRTGIFVSLIGIKGDRRILELELGELPQHPGIWKDGDVGEDAGEFRGPVERDVRRLSGVWGEQLARPAAARSIALYSSTLLDCIMVGGRELERELRFTDESTEE